MYFQDGLENKNINSVCVLQVAKLLDRMERLCGAPLHISIHTALKRHHAAVCIMQERCKEDCANMSKHQQQELSFTEDRGNPYFLIKPENGCSVSAVANLVDENGPTTSAAAWFRTVPEATSLSAPLKIQVYFGVQLRHINSHATDPAGVHSESRMA